MSTGILLLEFALLGFVAAVYALARRNLTAAAARDQAETAQSLQEVRETVAGLISVLQVEAAKIEERLSDRTRQLESLLAEQARGSVSSADRQSGPSAGIVAATERPPQHVADASEPLLTLGGTPVSAIERALQLIANGETALSAARQTALTLTEVEMAARMRGGRQRQP